MPLFRGLFIFLNVRIRHLKPDPAQSLAPLWPRRRSKGFLSAGLRAAKGGGWATSRCFPRLSERDLFMLYLEFSIRECGHSQLSSRSVFFKNFGAIVL